MEWIPKPFAPSSSKRDERAAESFILGCKELMRSCAQSLGINGNYQGVFSYVRRLFDGSGRATCLDFMRGMTTASTRLSCIRWVQLSRPTKNTRNMDTVILNPTTLLLKATTTQCYHHLHFDPSPTLSTP